MSSSRIVSRSGVTEHVNASSSGHEKLEELAQKTLQLLMARAAALSGATITKENVLAAAQDVFEPGFGEAVLDRSLR